MIFWQALGESEEGGGLKKINYCKKLNGVAFDSNTFYFSIQRSAY